MVFENDVWFNLIKTVWTTTLTLGLMISLTEFRFSRRTVLLAFGVYLFYVVASSMLIIRMFGYVLARDHAMKAIFNYMTQVDIYLLLTAPVAVMNQGSKALDIFLRAALLCSMIAVNYFFIRKPYRRYDSHKTHGDLCFCVRR